MERMDHKDIHARTKDIYRSRVTRSNASSWTGNPTSCTTRIHVSSENEKENKNKNKLVKQMGENRSHK